MPLSQPLSEIRIQIEELLIEDLPAALNALKELLPETADLRQQVQALLARLHQANKENIRGVLSSAEYSQRLASIRSDFFDLLSTMQATDFDVPKSVHHLNKSSSKHGTVLYRVPHIMPIRKPSLCKVRVAMDEDAILEDIILDDTVRLRNQVEVSDWMTAELIDPDGQTFQIRALNSAKQNIREEGYTQWLFSVTPLCEGVHELMVKVSLLQWDTNSKEYVPRDVSILETVTIVTEASAPSDSDESPMKPAGYQFVLPGSDSYTASAPSAEPNRLPQPQKTRTGPRGMRITAIFLAILMASSSAAWAFTPPPTRDWWVASFKNHAEAYSEYIEKYPQSPHREKAVYRKALATNKVRDYQKYLQEYITQGVYRSEVLQKIEALRLKEIASTPKTTTPNNILLPMMIYVKGGTFTMGCNEKLDKDCQDFEKPLHEVTLSDYYMSETEITQKQWRDIMNKNPSSVENCDKCPVEQVSWNDVQVFLKKLNGSYPGKNYRLPTEAEWEYAARGGQNEKGDFLYAGGNEIKDFAWFYENSDSKTHPVKQKEPNQLGLCDMSGNVWEWCSDWYDVVYYRNSPKINPKGPDKGSFRVYRGGSWRNLARNCRVSLRSNNSPDLRGTNIGFRVVSSSR